MPIMRKLNKDQLHSRLEILYALPRSKENFPEVTMNNQAKKFLKLLMLRDILRYLFMCYPTTVEMKL